MARPEATPGRMPDLRVDFPGIRQEIAEAATLPPVTLEVGEQIHHQEV
ncbi:MAG: hypothetical protein HOF74_13815 [Gammaproteobacteria bacterium]|nr:hypothetical protein [Gammaproteobacteria bacterium]MBT3860904.1 hypothetical protein [Gammaproteobacteria bacterium]MBT3988427.1 hypothetical protein [Gammaproteobacteria bacterium]MBT4581486.1 hypothetical protein [Gammaproteobacteria bacterium]MBT4657345.1 hypothetical protein [Gammaproteobacteria bacterium]